MGERDLSIDILRSLVVVMVVFFHSALAYASFITFNPSNYGMSPHPVVDTQRWPCLDLVIAFFDTFFMSLMFFLSGFFSLNGIERRGSRGYLVARTKRLGLPFIFGAVVVAPIAWWPAWRMSNHGSAAYLATFFTTDGWPLGPPWFLWVLLAIDGLFAMGYRFLPLSRALYRARPSILLCYLTTVLSYLALGLVLPDGWLSLGPFDFQPSRFLLYLAYFLLGASAGTDRKWLERGPTRHWVALLAFALVSFAAYLALTGRLVPLPSFFIMPLSKLAFAGCCFGASFGFVGFFHRLVRGTSPILDSLRDNSFGIYLIHYAIVVWLQYFLAQFSMPAGIKFVLVFSFGLCLSWGLVMAARKLRIARSVL